MSQFQFLLPRALHFKHSTLYQCVSLLRPSVVSRSGKRIVKNLGRVDSVERQHSREAGSSQHSTSNVRLFRLNSFVKDPGTQEEDGEPERQQWDRCKLFYFI